MLVQLLTFLCLSCICFCGYAGQGTVRLFKNGVADTNQSFTDGIVQVHYSGKWGNICADFASNERYGRDTESTSDDDDDDDDEDDSDSDSDSTVLFGLEEAHVICHQLGYTGALWYSNTNQDTKYGTDNSSTAVLSQVSCSSSLYLSITQCSFSTSISSSCNDAKDVIVSCNSTKQLSSPTTGDIRLNGGSYTNKGKLELYCGNDQWSAVCFDSFSATEAAIACRQLGYNDYGFNQHVIQNISTKNTWTSMPVTSCSSTCLKDCGVCLDFNFNSTACELGVTLSCEYKTSKLKVTNNASSCLEPSDISSTTTTSVAARFTVASSNSVIFTSYDGTITHTTNSIQQYNSIIQPFTSITTTDYESTSLMSTNINTIRTTTKAATPTNNQNSEKFEIMAKTTITIGAVLGSVIVIFIVVLILLVILGIRHIKQKKMAQHQCGIPERRKDNTELSASLPSPSLRSTEHSIVSESNDIIAQKNSISRILQPCLIEPTDLKLLEKIGQGEFGVVYRGLLVKYKNDEPIMLSVAVKTLRSYYSFMEIDQMIEEAEKMKTFSHLNVLSLTGVCIGLLESPCIVMPFMSNGSLLSYLRKEAPNLTISKYADENLIQDTTKQLLSMCLQVAKGMAYLAGEKLVHRDLAARNCMMSAEGVIKVADFGLSKDVYTTQYFKIQHSSSEVIKLPIKWMALESIHYEKFTEKTDVWSFGVLCWEVFSVGKTPYPGMTPDYIVETLEAGERLKKPTNSTCTEEIYSLMLQCWDESPQKRPHFLKTVKRLEEILVPLAGYIDVSHSRKGSESANSLLEEIQPIMDLTL